LTEVAEADSLPVYSKQWWAGMTMMILGELLNLVAYSFVDAVSAIRLFTSFIDVD
jgi:hypothetical protein